MALSPIAASFGSIIGEELLIYMEENDYDIFDGEQCSIHARFYL